MESIMYCPYHGQDHPTNTVFTPEHIIPYALGGSNRFTIQVCKKINSDVGSQIDARFQSVFPVAYERFIRNIESYSGTEPSLLFQGTTEFGGRAMEIEYEIAQSEKNIALTPSIQKENTSVGIRYFVQTTPQHFEEMLHNLERKYPGKAILDESGNAISLSEVLAGAQTTVPKITCKWDTGEWDFAAKREFVKIALGTAHFLLGEEYSRSRSADHLRRFLHAGDAELPTIPIHGQTWPVHIPPMPFLYHGVHSDQHLITLLNLDERLTVFVSLFGEMRGLIQIADDPIICKSVRTGDGFVLAIDPITRAFKKRTFEELLKSFR